MADQVVNVHLTQQTDYQFKVEFGAPTPALMADEPAPLGKGSGPSPVQLLAAAVGNCLSDSLLFALRKFKLDAGQITCEVQAHVGRHPEGRIRVLSMLVRLNLSQGKRDMPHLGRVLGQFEDFCTVTQSVRQAIPIQVTVCDAMGGILHPAPSTPKDADLHV